MRTIDKDRAFFKLDLLLNEVVNNINIRTAMINEAVDIIILLNNEHKIQSIIENEHINDFENRCGKYNETYKS